MFNNRISALFKNYHILACLYSIQIEINMKKKKIIGCYENFKKEEVSNASFESRDKQITF